MTRIAILDDYQNVSLHLADWDSLPKGCTVTVFNEHLGTDEETIAGRLAEFDVICMMRERTPFPESLIVRLPNLKLLITSGLHNASVDTDAVAARNITFCGTPSPGHSTAELVWALILAHSRNLGIEFASMAEGRWQTTLGRSLKGLRLGVIGLGKQGGQVAGFGKAFGMDVVAWSQNLMYQRAADVGVTGVGKEELLRTSDVITIHLRLSERTRGLIGAKEFSMMKSDALLVNTSRGPIVEEGALVAALESQSIGGAALDVYDVEPLPADHRLRGNLRGLMLSPHLGFVSQESYRAFYSGFVAIIRGFLEGAAPNRIF
jgi:phosphoglycerate dehydrogenase-like enzyme